MSFDALSTTLLLVDFQSRLMPAIAEGANAVANAKRLAQAASALGIPVLGTEENVAGLGETVADLKPLIERTLAKTHFDATRELAWPSFLAPERRDVLVAGSESHVCVLQTVTGLLRRGHPVRVVRDAVASRTPENCAAGLKRAEWCGAELVTTEMVIFEWLGHCEHPQFRNLLQLIKN